MKRILVISPFFYPHVGGSEQYMENLYVTLKQAHPDIQIDVLCYNTDKTLYKESFRGLTIYRLPCLNILPGKFVLPNPFALISFLLHKSRHPYNLIHTSTRFFDSSWWAPIFAKVTGSKAILTDHCAGTPKHSNLVINVLVSIVDTVTGKLFLALYDKIFVVSRATKIFLKQKFNVQSKVLYGGVSKVFFNTNKKTLRNRTQVVYAGRMIPAKGVLELFDIASKMSQIDVFFAGQGELVRILRKKIILNNLSNIQILGQVDKKRLASLFKRSDIFVYPSYHPEGVPMALLEAGASKLAVIATNTGGVKEIIKNEQTGLLINPKDEKSLKSALEKLINNKTLRRKFGQNLGSYIKHRFIWKKSAEEFYLEIQKLHQNTHRDFIPRRVFCEINQACQV